MMLGYLENLTAFGPRVTSTSACGEAGKYIYNEFKGMGLDVRYQNWSMDELYGSNIEATINGFDETSDKIFVISAHYDSPQRSPGANDDGSGVAAVLAIANVMSQYTFNHTIRFVTFSGEEQGLLGSHFYVEESYNNNDNIIAVLNADQMGGAETEDEGSRVWVIENELSNWITEFTINASQRYSEYIGLEIIPQDISSGHVSDNTNFWQFEYDAILYHEPIDHNKNIHSPDDKIENMDIPFAIKVSRLIFATLAEFAWSE